MAVKTIWIIESYASLVCTMCDDCRMFGPAAFYGYVFVYNLERHEYNQIAGLSCCGFNPQMNVRLTFPPSTFMFVRQLIQKG